MKKIGFERFEEKEMDYAEGDRRINKGERFGCGEIMATILEYSSSNSSIVNTMSVLIFIICT